MLCVGFLEEVIFRGLLFTAIARNNIKSAVIISSVTFGIGHIINLFNGSGMELVSNLCQIVFAIAVGFLLVTIFSRGGSLLPCILVHSAINTLGTFANDAELTMQTQLLHLAALILLTVGYTLILTRTLPRNTECNTRKLDSARIQEQYERLLPDFSSDTGWRVSLAPDGTLALTALDPEHGASIYYAHDVMPEPMIFRSVALPIGTN